jgi:hypothetical protein
LNPNEGVQADIWKSGQDVLGWVPLVRHLHRLGRVALRHEFRSTCDDQLMQGHERSRGIGWAGILVAGLLAACGGKAVIDGARGAGGTGGRSSTSSTTGGGGGGGGCDAASHTIEITDYNVGCTVASDCVPVFFGSFCTNCWCPLSAAINVADKVRYDAEAQIKSAGVPPPACNCPASEGICVQGQCAVQVP